MIVVPLSVSQELAGGAAASRDLLVGYLLLDIVSWKENGQKWIIRKVLQVVNLCGRL